MTRVLHRHTKMDPPVAVGGSGCFIKDANGKEYLDASGGAAVSCLGHGHPAVTEAIRQQLDRIAFAHTAFFTSEPAEALALWLTDRAPGDLNHAYFVCGGSEAIEASLKLARQYFLETGQPDRHRIIARRQSYHGSTLGALSTGGNLERREAYSPLLLETHHIAPCYPYRDCRDGESLEDYGQRVANDLDATIRRLGPDTVMAFVAEPVVGATAGVLVPAPGYFRRIREICDSHGVLLVFDEVMCGMGRTGTLFACEQESVTPDILAIAKGLGAGYQPIGAMLLSDRIFEAVRDGSGFFRHGHTYLGHPLACAAALAVQQTIESEGLLEKVRERGEKLERSLIKRFGNHAHIGDIRGRGLFWGIEIVADRITKEPFDPALKLHSRIKANAMDEGLVCYPLSGTIDGKRGNHILLAPPFIISEDEIDLLVGRLGIAIDSAIEQSI